MILSGELKVGQRLPTERELSDCKSFPLSPRSTLQPVNPMVVRIPISINKMIFFI
ncbi:MAG: GntR family transcriptional regulator [Lachnospiraceae bacterium]|nr:GntR family transcriptional regulator [Lachnospiraceae bacterium]